MVILDENVVDRDCENDEKEYILCLLFELGPLIDRHNDVALMPDDVQLGIVDLLLVNLCLSSVPLFGWFGNQALDIYQKFLDL